MARGLDVSKLDVWRERLVRFDGSGLTVAAFCRQEGLASHRFYYWSRRVQEAGSVVPDWSSDSGRKSTTGKSTMRSDRSSDALAQVEVILGEQVRLRLPADNTSLIVAVLSSLQNSTQAIASGGAFQRVALVTRR